MRRIGAGVVVWIVALSGALAVPAGQTPSSEFRYVNDGTRLVRPTDYRNWAWVSSGLGMTYEGEAARPGQPPTFTNVFVNPSSYQAFLKTGRWPDRTIFVLEFRASTSQGSINTGGFFQGQLLGVEAEVKDSRFPDGWAFYNFGQAASLADDAEPIADATRCVECHTKHTAVERTFVQFYPTLMDVARKMGTVKAGF